MTEPGDAAAETVLVASVKETRAILRSFTAEDASVRAESMKGHATLVRVISVLGDPSLVAAGDDDGCILVWDVSQPSSPVSRIPHPQGADKQCGVRSLAALGSHWLLAGYRNGAVFFWNYITGAPRARAPAAHADTVDACVRADAAGRFAVTCDAAGALALWDTDKHAALAGSNEAAQPCWTWRAPVSEPQAFTCADCVTPQGSDPRIVTASQTGTVLVWELVKDMAALHRLHKFSLSPNTHLLSCAFLNDTEVAFGVSYVGTVSRGAVEIWDVATHLRSARLKRPGASVAYSITALSPHRIAVASETSRADGSGLAIWSRPDPSAHLLSAGADVDPARDDDDRKASLTSQSSTDWAVERVFHHATWPMAAVQVRPSNGLADRMAALCRPDLLASKCCVS